jgi:hypothetical protein
MHNAEREKKKEKQETDTIRSNVNGREPHINPCTKYPNTAQ